MTKILCIVMFAVSLMGGATVVLAQSSRDLTEPTGTEAITATMAAGIPRMRTRRALTDDGIGPTGTGDLSERLKRRYLQSTHLCRLRPVRVNRDRGRQSQTPTHVRFAPNRTNSGSSRHVR